MNTELVYHVYTAGYEVPIVVGVVALLVAVMIISALELPGRDGTAWFVLICIT